MKIAENEKESEEEQNGKGKGNRRGTRRKRKRRKAADIKPRRKCLKAKMARLHQLFFVSRDDASLYIRRWFLARKRTFPTYELRKT